MNTGIVSPVQKSLEEARTAAIEVIVSIIITWIILFL